MQLPDPQFAPRIDRSRSLRRAVGRRPLTLPLLRLWPAFRSGEVISRSTDYCVEGFPFSANTYAYATVLDSNPRLRGAHHTHMEGQILLAARRGIPTALVVRHPLQACESLAVFHGHTPAARYFLARWISFHQRLLEVIEQGLVVVCPFEQITVDPAYVVEALNDRFDAGLAPPGSSADDLLAKSHQIRGARGMPPRSAYEEELSGSLDELRDSLRTDPRAAEALALYERICAYAFAGREAATSS